MTQQTTKNRKNSITSPIDIVSEVGGCGKISHRSITWLHTVVLYRKN